MHRLRMHPRHAVVRAGSPSKCTLRASDHSLRFAPCLSLLTCNERISQPVSTTSLHVVCSALASGSQMPHSLRLSYRSCRTLIRFTISEPPQRSDDRSCASGGSISRLRSAQVLRWERTAMPPCCHPASLGAFTGFSWPRRMCADFHPWMLTCIQAGFPGYVTKCLGCHCHSGPRTLRIQLCSEHGFTKG